MLRLRSHVIYNKFSQRMITPIRRQFCVKSDQLKNLENKLNVLEDRIKRTEDIIDNQCVKTPRFNSREEAIGTGIIHGIGAMGLIIAGGALVALVFN